MQHVKATWLRIYTYALVLIDTLVIGAFVWMRAFGGSSSVQTTWGITTLVAVICGLHAGYALTVYRVIYQRLTWLANVISVSIWGYFLVVVIDTSGHTFLLYRLLLIVYMFFLGMNGVFPPIAGVLLVWIVQLLTMTAALDGGSAPLVFNLIVDVVVTLGGIAGWYIFRNFYIGTASSEELQLANSLKKEQSKSSFIIESIIDGVIIIDPAGTVQQINNSASSTLGWSKDEAVGIDFHHLMTAVQEGNQTAAAPANPIETTLKTGQATQSVSLFKTRAKDNVYFDILASPIVQEQSATTQNGVVVVFRDVSAARAEEKAKADFISTASHEMRTPVAAIEGYLALALNEKVSQIDERARQYLLKAHQNTQHLGELFQDLLTTTKAEDGRLVNNPEVVEMSEFLQQLSSDLQFVAEKKGLQVSFVAGGTSSSTNKVIKPLYYVLVDPTRIQEVITNLFDNAVKYTEKGSITLTITGDQDVVQCSIADTGHGIPTEDIKHLFQKFYRVDSSVTRTIGGTGLGLFICRKIVELYGGRIWVESKLGEGSTFFINIPRMTAQQASEWQQAHPVLTATTPNTPTPQQPVQPTV